MSVQSNGQDLCVMEIHVGVSCIFVREGDTFSSVAGRGERGFTHGHDQSLSTGELCIYKLHVFIPFSSSFCDNQGGDQHSQVQVFRSGLYPEALSRVETLSYETHHFSIQTK